MKSREMGNREAKRKEAKKKEVKIKEMKSKEVKRSGMRKWVGKAACGFLGAAIFLGAGTAAQAAELEYTNGFSLSDGSAVTIDGDFSDWNALPCSYEYNWDNSDNCWQWGVWVDGVCYKTEPGTYSTDVRHKMQMYCDGENVYLHIVYSRDYGARLNGSDFQFFVNGQMAAFQVVAPGGGSFEAMSENDPGAYPLEIRHRDTGLSFLNAEGTDGYLRVTENRINNEIEIRIPLAELQRQNPQIDAETITSIEFFTPNLMYRRISAVGTSSGPVLLSALCGSVVLCGWLGFKRKKDGYLQV